MGPPSSFDAGGLSVASGSGQATQAPFDASALGHGNPNPLQLVQPTPVAGIQANVSSRNIDQCRSPEAPVFRPAYPLHAPRAGS